MAKTAALLFLLFTVIGLAHLIEITARPSTGRQGVHVHGESGGGH